MSGSDEQMSFDVTSGNHFIDTGGEISITSYFQQRSHKMGELCNDKPPPNERVSYSLAPRVIGSCPSQFHVVRACPSYMHCTHC